MSATDELRRLLDERGVEWWPSDEFWNSDVITHWYAGLLKWTAIEGEDGLWVNAGVAGHNSLTPEQAVEATLGSCNCSNSERNSERTGTLTAEKVRELVEENSRQYPSPTDPRGNAGKYVGLRQGEYWERTENSDYYCGGCGWKVTDHDSYCPECGGALHKATLGRDTCHVVEYENTGIYVCSECGAVQPEDYTVYYCWCCGRKVVLSG